MLSLRCGDLRSPGVKERRNGPLGLRDDDGDDCKIQTRDELCSSFGRRRANWLSVSGNFGP